MKYRNKVNEIEAIFYDGSNKADVEKFLGTHCAEYNDTLPFVCWYNDGMSMRAYCGEFIIKLPDGKTFAIWNEIFDGLFEPVKQGQDENK